MPAGSAAAPGETDDYDDHAGGADLGDRAQQQSPERRLADFPAGRRLASLPGLAGDAHRRWHQPLRTRRWQSPIRRPEWADQPRHPAIPPPIEPHSARNAARWLPPARDVPHRDRQPLEHFTHHSHHQDDAHHSQPTSTRQCRERSASTPTTRARSASCRAATTASGSIRQPTVSAARRPPTEVR